MLYEKLTKYTASNVYPMHMPGHKRNPEFCQCQSPYSFDITEIHGFDTLCEPCGLIEETAELAAGLYSSRKAFLLINGSTVGILAAIGAHTKRDDKILFAESCHRSVHNAAVLFGLKPIYIPAVIDESSGVECGIAPSAVLAALESNPDIKLVVITSPSYEGVVSDIASIAGIAHEHGTLLLVDSAHGAHLGFSGGFPENAVRCGADIVVMSLHKTLPALTQCSLLHICGEQANETEINRMLNIMQTSSPSYVLMASIDRCLRLLAFDNKNLFGEYERRLNDFYNSIKGLRRLYVTQHAQWGSLTIALPAITQENRQPSPLPYALDPGKIVIITKDASLTGFEFADILRCRYKIELEAAHADYAIAMTSICDSAEGFMRLSAALLEVDGQVLDTQLKG